MAKHESYNRCANGHSYTTYVDIPHKVKPEPEGVPLKKFAERKALFAQLKEKVA